VYGWEGGGRTQALTQRPVARRRYVERRYVKVECRREKMSED
jgi:hypothetical protein